MSDNRYWNKLCYHVVVRSMIYGNVYMQPLFATKQALFFNREDVIYFVGIANWQIVLFNGIGWLCRFILWKFPKLEKYFIYFGLLLWILGLIILAGFSRNITLPIYESITMLCLSIGGGMYYWSTIDDIIYMNGNVPNYHIILAILGVLSTLYMYFTHWLYIDYANFIIVYPTLLTLALPSTILVIVEEFSNKLEIKEKEIKESNNKHNTSFGIHILFMIIYGIFKNIPAMTLYLGHNHTTRENEVLLFWRTVGFVLGEILFVLVYQWIYIPVVVCIALPLILKDWIFYVSNFDIIIVDVVLYAYCVGILNVWVYRRVLMHWEEIGSSKTNLNLLILIMSTSLFPGDILINWFVYLNDQTIYTLPSSMVLYPSLYLSIALLVLLVAHSFSFIVFNT
jgi:hypothetical protein